jgi:hypothetical protein
MKSEYLVLLNSEELLLIITALLTQQGTAAYKSLALALVQILNSESNDAS